VRLLEVERGGEGVVDAREVPHRGARVVRLLLLLACFRWRRAAEPSRAGPSRAKIASGGGNERERLGDEDSRLPRGHGAEACRLESRPKGPGGFGRGFWEKRAALSSEGAFSHPPPLPFRAKYKKVHSMQSLSTLQKGVRFLRTLNIHLRHVGPAST
jgi:hypothetical protein